MVVNDVLRHVELIAFFDSFEYMRVLYGRNYRSYRRRDTVYIRVLGSGIVHVCNVTPIFFSLWVMKFTVYFQVPHTRNLARPWWCTTPGNWPMGPSLIVRDSAISRSNSPLGRETLSRDGNMVWLRYIVFDCNLNDTLINRLICILRMMERCMFGPSIPYVLQKEVIHDFLYKI